MKASTLTVDKGTGVGVVIKKKKSKRKIKKKNKKGSWINSSSNSEPQRSNCLWNIFVKKNLRIDQRDLVEYWSWGWCCCLPAWMPETTTIMTGKHCCFRSLRTGDGSSWELGQGNSTGNDIYAVSTGVGVVALWQECWKQQQHDQKTLPVLKLLELYGDAGESSFKTEYDISSSIYSRYCSSKVLIKYWGLGCWCCYLTQMPEQDRGLMGVLLLPEETTTA